MKKIIFIELLHHHECLENPYLFFKNKWYETKAILGEFVSHKLKNITKFSDEFYILKQPNRKVFSSFNFFWKIKYIMKEYIEIYKNTQEIIKIIHQEKPEYLYINTIESPFLIPLMYYLLKVKNIKIYLTIHNTNRIKVWFCKYILFDWLIKKLIIKADKVILLWEYLKFKNKKVQDKVIYFNNRIIKKKSNKKFEKITFVIPGSLDCNNKDYESVLKGFWQFFKENKKNKNKVQLVLLGQLNVKVANWIKLYNLSESVITFDTYVGEKDMEMYMSWAHYCVISTFNGSIYGKYKITWAFWDAVWFNIPIILSENYAPDYKSDNVIRFKNNNFILTLNILMKNY